VDQNPTWNLKNGVSLETLLKIPGKSEKFDEKSIFYIFLEISLIFLGFSGAFLGKPIVKHPS
jgi:hypothetical protein